MFNYKADVSEYCSFSTNHNRHLLIPSIITLNYYAEVCALKTEQEDAKSFTQFEKQKW